MNFRTLIEYKSNTTPLSYDQKMFFIGSCFAENIGAKLSELKFDLLVNPYGVSYNPKSLTEIFSSILDRRVPQDGLLVEDDGLWYSMMHGTKIFGSSKEDLLSKITEINARSRDFLLLADTIFITLGTAWIYEDLSLSKVVNNCLKQSSKKFIRRRLTVEEICGDFGDLFVKYPLFKTKKIFLTISPVRHIKDGLIENNLSKSTLLVAAHNLVEKFDNVFYFPAYEIVNDELRDYRYYDDDMLHPSKLAVDYIFEKLIDWCFVPKTKEFIKDNLSVQLALSHRAVNVNSPKYVEFCESMLKKIKTISSKYPQKSYLCEIEYFENKIK